MKKFFLSAILVSSSLIGCGKLQMPTTPAVQSQTTASVPQTAATPVFVTGWETSKTLALVNPQAVAVDASGRIYVTDLALNSVLKFDVNGTLLQRWGNGGDNSLDEPTGIAVQNGDVYVADAANARVVEYDTNGNYLTQIAPQDSNNDPLFVYPTGLSFDGQGYLYVSDNSDRVYAFNPLLQLSATWGSNGSFDFPMVSAEDANGNMFVADYNSNSIAKMDLRSGALTNWGTTGTQNGQMEGPSDVKLGQDGNVYVADSLNNRIEIFSTTGTYLGQFGNSGNASQMLNSPSAMAFDGNGNLYVVDNGNGRIVKYTVK